VAESLFVLTLLLADARAVTPSKKCSKFRLVEIAFALNAHQT